MMTLHCDESDDGHTYALAGWLSVPMVANRFDRAWRSMLQSIAMPDGTPCKAFHAADIVGRDQISDSPFRGWTFDDEVAAFSKATDIVVDREVCANLWPVAVATEIPSTFTWVLRDSIWLILFTKLFQLLASHYPAQRSISFVFDEKASIAPHARQLFDRARQTLNDLAGEEYLHTFTFASDEEVLGLQAADFIAYEWRKRITDQRLTPGKAIRRSYRRIKVARREGALWLFGREIFEEALKADDQSTAWARAVLHGNPTRIE